MSAFDREATLERRLGAVHRRVTDVENLFNFQSHCLPNLLNVTHIPHIVSARKH